MNPSKSQAESFKALVNSLRQALQEPEQFTLSYAAESSAFVRFNHARVRQAGQVQQASIGLKLINEGRHADLNITLAGDPQVCLLYTSPSPRDGLLSRMPSSA